MTGVYTGIEAVKSRTGTVGLKCAEPRGVCLMDMANGIFFGKMGRII